MKKKQNIFETLKLSKYSFTIQLSLCYLFNRIRPSQANLTFPEAQPPLQSTNLDRTKTQTIPSRDT